MRTFWLSVAPALALERPPDAGVRIGAAKGRQAVSAREICGRVRGHAAPRSAVQGLTTDFLAEKNERSRMRLLFALLRSFRLLICCLSHRVLSKIMRFAAPPQAILLIPTARGHSCMHRMHRTPRTQEEAGPVGPAPSASQLASDSGGKFSGSHWGKVMIESRAVCEVGTPQAWKNGPRFLPMV
jgi:hypothetical protein